MKEIFAIKNVHVHVQIGCCHKIGSYPRCRFCLYLFNGFIEFLQITSITKPLCMRSYDQNMMYTGQYLKEIFAIKNVHVQIGCCCKIGSYPWCRFCLYLFNGFIEYLQITSITKPLLMRNYDQILIYIGWSIQDIFNIIYGSDPTRIRSVHVRF